MKKKKGALIRYCRRIKSAKCWRQATCTCYLQVKQPAIIVLSSHMKFSSTRSTHFMLLFFEAEEIRKKAEVKRKKGNNILRLNIFRSSDRHLILSCFRCQRFFFFLSSGETVNIFKHFYTKDEKVPKCRFRRIIINDFVQNLGVRQTALSERAVPTMKFV